MKPSYYGQDILGSVVLETNEDGTKQKSYDYDAYGQLIEGKYSRISDLGYTGKRIDAVTGWYNYGYRDYDPMVMRFTTVDPIRSGSNWYAYVGGDPVNYVDPWGLSESDGQTADLREIAVENAWENPSDPLNNYWSCVTVVSENFVDWDVPWAPLVQNGSNAADIHNTLMAATENGTSSGTLSATGQTIRVSPVASAAAAQAFGDNSVQGVDITITTRPSNDDHEHGHMQTVVPDNNNPPRTEAQINAQGAAIVQGGIAPDEYAAAQVRPIVGMSSATEAYANQFLGSWAASYWRIVVEDER